MRREVEGRGEEPITLRRRGVELRKRERERFSGQDSETPMIYDEGTSLSLSRTETASCL